MLKTQDEINAKEFIGKSSIVTVKMTGDRNIKEVKIDAEEFAKDEIEMLEDMISIAVNDALRQIDKETNDKMGSYTNGLPGIF